MTQWKLEPTAQQRHSSPPVSTAKWSLCVLLLLLLSTAAVYYVPAASWALTKSSRRLRSAEYAQQQALEVDATLTASGATINLSPVDSGGVSSGSGAIRSGAEGETDTERRRRRNASPASGSGSGGDALSVQPPLDDQGKYSPLPFWNFTGTRAEEFVSRCVDQFPLQLPEWSVTAGDVTAYRTARQKFVCTQGRNLFRLGESTPVTWLQASAPRKVKLHPLPHRLLDSLPLRDALHLDDDAVAAGQNRTAAPRTWASSTTPAVVYHPSVAVVSTAMLSMFHLHSDFLMPMFASLHDVLGRELKVQPPIVSGPLDVVLLYLDGQNRGHGSDEATRAFALSMVPKGGQLRSLIDPEVVDKDRTYHCYCGALLQQGSVISTLAGDARMASGDPLRRRATRHVQRRLNEHFAFLPHGLDLPVPRTEFAPFGLWSDDPPSPAAPRLLFVLRNQTRLIGNPDALAAAARVAGFHVHVMTPEHESVALQARAARYADVLMGMHGQALTWMVLMDTLVAPHCRVLVELQYYGRPLHGVHNVYEYLAADNFLRYHRVAAVDATFDPKYVSSREGEKTLLNTRPFPHRLRGFLRQTAYFNAGAVEALLRQVQQRVGRCAPRNLPDPLTPAEIRRSAKAFGPSSLSKAAKKRH